jgi:hypothetical protein
MGASQHTEPMAAEGLHTTTSRAQGHWRIPQLLSRGLLRTNQVRHPAVPDEAKRRSDDIQLRLADRITAFAGSMKFVSIHAALSPYGWCSWKEPVVDTDSGCVT